MGEGPELSLREVLAQAPDPRCPRGRQHPLAVCVMPGGGRNLYALAQWGRSHPELAQSRGFTR